MRNRVSYRSYQTYIPAVETPTFLTLSDVEKVLLKLTESIDRTGYATVEEFYKLTGGTVLEDDAKCGWTNLIGCRTYKTRYGYTLEMPLPKELNSDPIKEAYDILCNNADDCNDAVDEAIDLLSKAL